MLQLRYRTRPLIAAVNTRLRLWVIIEVWETGSIDLLIRRRFGSFLAVHYGIQQAFCQVKRRQNGRTICWHTV